MKQLNYSSLRCCVSFSVQPKDSVVPYAWQHQPLKRLKTAATVNVNEPELAYQHLPFESDFQLSDPQDPPSFLWEDRYLQHPDLRSLPRSQDVFRKIELDPCLLLALPKPSATAGRILEHAIQTFEDLVSKNKPLTFKFGITHDASIRWNNETFGYKYSKDIFDYMLVIYGASNPYGPAFLEAALIDRFGGFLFAMSSILTIISVRSKFSPNTVGLSTPTFHTLSLSSATSV